MKVLATGSNAYISSGRAWMKKYVTGSKVILCTCSVVAKECQSITEKGDTFIIPRPREEQQIQASYYTNLPQSEATMQQQLKRTEAISG